jgi:putative spermidine/putrescine transport system ATP-binding protein/spermidine/putrescine transport system ATP-binding protein
MAGVELKNVSKSFGPVVAVENADATFEEGSFTTLLGPSGCGKTTILRMIAGLEATTAGDIEIDGRRVNDVPIHKRNLGLVFQNYALFPHKTIEQNIAFGLKYRGMNRADARDKVKRALDIVRLPGVEDRYPSQLSGGQQQRIALARAIVIEPDVLLLDEPLSALDANLREDMRVELKTIQRRIGITTIFVTHDQSEALALSDKIVVMSDGHVEQTGSPQQVYGRPASRFVARFLGNSNILEARVVATGGKAIKVAVDGLGEMTVEGEKAVIGDKVFVVIRAEHLRLEAAGKSAGKACNRLRGTVTMVDYQGQVARYFVTVAGHSLEAINGIDGSPLAEGTAVTADVRPNDIVLLVD